MFHLFFTNAGEISVLIGNWVVLGCSRRGLGTRLLPPRDAVQLTAEVFMEQCSANMHTEWLLGEMLPMAVCQICDRPRCKAKGANGEQCRRFPSNGTAVCHSHGGGTHASRSKGMRETIQKKLAFWNPDRPQITDVSEAILNLASNMNNTYEVLSAQLDDLLGNYKDEVRAFKLNAEDGGCMCCGHFPERPVHPLQSPEAHTWQFVVRELANLLKAIQQLGILERAVAVEEAKVSLVVAAIERAAISVDMPEEHLRTFRNTFVSELRAIETRRAQPEALPAPEVG